MKTKINVFCLVHGEQEAKEVQALVKLYTTTNMFEPSYCRTQEINLFNKVKLIWTHLGVLVQRNWSGEQVDGQISSEPSPQSSSLSHTHWEGMQRPPAQLNSDSRQGGEGGGQATPSHFQTPSSQELNTQRQKVFMDSSFTKDKNKEYSFINVQKDWPVLAVLSDSSSSWKQGAIPLTRTLAGNYTAVACFIKSIQTKNVRMTVGRWGLDWYNTPAQKVQMGAEVQNSCSYLILVVRRSVPD